MSNRMTNDDLIKLGFKPIPHFTIQNSVIYDLGRNRHLSAGDVGTPNEMIFIGEIDSEDDKKITDCICLHNYDYDGYVTEQKVKLLIEALTNDLWFKKNNSNNDGVGNDAHMRFIKNIINKSTKKKLDYSGPTIDFSEIEPTDILKELGKRNELSSYKKLYNDYLTEIQFNNRIQFKIPFCEWLDNKFN